MQRRDFLKLAAAAAGGVALPTWHSDRVAVRQCSWHGPTHSIIPVVGDGHWIWNEPPRETGYLEERPFSLKIGIEIEGTGAAGNLMASTPVPVAHPEQRVDELRVTTHGCQAELRELAPGAGQLILAAPQIARGQTIAAIAHYRLTLFKQYQGHQRDHFPARQDVPAEIRAAALQDSPGIQTSAAPLRRLAIELIDKIEHPWDRAAVFVRWVRQNIHPQIGPYTSVTAALENRRGDCEEMAAVFVALCRAVGIPARLVWVPNHNWAEFYLTDHDGAGHWIPAHTACYFWFGWTGVHELVLQKGDRVRVPEQNKQVRLLEDWLRWSGRKPQARYVAQLEPLPKQDRGDAGPGARQKLPSGEWKLLGAHPMDRYLRQG
jgi:hypothetical protein